MSCDIEHYCANCGSSFPPDVMTQLAEAKAEVIGCEAQLRGFELALNGGVLGDTLTIMDRWPFARALHEAVRLYAQLTRYKRVVEAAQGLVQFRLDLERAAPDGAVIPDGGPMVWLQLALAECREGEPTP